MDEMYDIQNLLISIGFSGSNSNNIASSNGFYYYKDYRVNIYTQENISFIRNDYDMGLKFNNIQDFKKFLNIEFTHIMRKIKVDNLLK